MYMHYTLNIVGMFCVHTDQSDCSLNHNFTVQCIQVESITHAVGWCTFIFRKYNYKLFSKASSDHKVTTLNAIMTAMHTLYGTGLHSIGPVSSFGGSFVLLLANCTVNVVIGISHHSNAHPMWVGMCIYMCAHTTHVTQCVRVTLLVPP